MRETRRLKLLLLHCTGKWKRRSVFSGEMLRAAADLTDGPIAVDGARHEREGRDAVFPIHRLGCSKLSCTTI